MPRKRATRVNQRAKPKKPEGEIGDELGLEERQRKLSSFLMDFDIEVKLRLEQIEKEKHRIKSMIQKEINLQLSYLPKEIREMNIMDFVEAGGTVDAALMKLSEAGEGDSFVDTDFGKSRAACEKERGIRKGKALSNKTNTAPSSAIKTTAKKRSRFQTPSTRQIPAVWDTPMVTPKFDVNLPFTPGYARAPKAGERLMSLAGSPVDSTSTLKVSKTLKHTRIQEEEEDLETAVGRVAAAVPGLAKTDIQKFLAEFTAANSTSSS